MRSPRRSKATHAPVPRYRNRVQSQPLTNPFAPSDAAGPNTEILTPTTRIDFPENTTSVRALWFEGGDSTSVYVTTSVVGVDLGYWITARAKHFEAWGVTIAFLAFLLALGVLVRRDKQLQKFKAGCCSSCEYDVQVPGATVCPECGGSVASATHTPWRRLLAPGFVAVCAFAALGLVLRISASATAPESEDRLRTFHPVAIQVLAPDFRHWFGSSFGLPREVDVRTETFRYDLRDGSRTRLSVTQRGRLWCASNGVGLRSAWDNEQNETLMFVNLLDGSTVDVWKGPDADCPASPEEMVLLSGSCIFLANDFTLWHVRPGSPLRQISPPHDSDSSREYYFICAVPGPHPMVAAVSCDREAIDWFSTDGELLSSTPTPSYIYPPVFAPDGSATRVSDAVGDETRVEWFAVPALLDLAESEPPQSRIALPLDKPPPSTVLIREREHPGVASADLVRGGAALANLYDTPLNRSNLTSRACLSPDGTRAIDVRFDARERPSLVVWNVPSP